MTKKKTTKDKEETAKVVDAYHEHDPRLAGKKEAKLPNDFYEKELFRLQVELVKLQEWVKETGL
jgi:polyphosphate kinase 2 (PPK2 family)